MQYTEQIDDDQTGSLSLDQKKEIRVLLITFIAIIAFLVLCRIFTHGINGTIELVLDNLFDSL